MESFRQLGCRIDNAVAPSAFGRFFHLETSGHEHEIKNSTFLTEIRAGLTTFFTMAYIISVNALVLTDSGATCVCNDAKDPTCTTDPDYRQCLLEVHRDLITATSAITGIGSFMFGLLTNIPVALAPGMGINAYFAYQVVGFHGTGPIPYRLALTAVFLEGLIFILLSLTGMRHWLMKLIPVSVKIASACGIGLFLALIGLSYSAGIGLVTGSTTAPLEIAGCPPQYLDEVTGACTSHRMQNPQLWLGVFLGFVLTAYLMSYKVKSSFIIGILIVSIVSWPRTTSFTYFPYTPDGEARFEFFKKIVTFNPIRHTLNALDWNLSTAGSHFTLALFTLLYVDILDCTATLYSMARFSGVVDPETSDFPRSTIAYCTDASSISIGALLGTSPVTAFIESGAGIAEGGKTGLTAMTVGVCFLVSIFFAPIFASVPPWATGCTLILVGGTMCRQITLINWSYVGDALPAFVTFTLMPFTYSIAYGLIAGLVTYALINGLTYLTYKLSGGRIQTIDPERQEYWSWKAGRPWFVTAVKDPKGFWRSGGGPRGGLAGGVGEAEMARDREEEEAFGGKGLDEGAWRMVSGTECKMGTIVRVMDRPRNGGDVSSSSITSAAPGVGVANGIGIRHENGNERKAEGDENNMESVIDIGVGM
ncbi:MAG: hypothetical protein M1834_002963 [Cirrosporium novae-zelandiae]|nr:MAG: hypothetical protein M1834_002963 [Cirrosporium novae-zelandiae]